MEFFERIVDLCEKKGITRNALEKEIGVSKGSSSKWKEFTPQTKTLNKLADYFKVPVSYLLYGNEKEDVPEYDPNTVRLISLYSKLNEKDKDIIINCMEGLIARSSKLNKKDTTSQ